MATEETAPPGIDYTRPSIARVYDFMLGGKNNFAIDREVAAMALKVTPDGPAAGEANRRFLRRVVHTMIAAGIDQILDLGSGLPTQGNVHEIAQAADPRVKVVYVDNDPMCLAHARALLADSPNTTIIEGDVRDPDSILDDRKVREFIDFSRPVGLLMLAILHHFHDDEDPGAIAGRFIDALPPGSFVAISHFHNPGDAMPDVAASALSVEKIFNEHLGTGRWRSHDEILAYFHGTVMLEPGIVPVAAWRPDLNDPQLLQPNTYYTFVGGLSRKP